ncbi:MAG: hypothetical protein EB117_09175 [Betaproteobacteria bacterium]|nr:hypothetical protein [Betaproteobacteria bacterium]
MTPEQEAKCREAFEAHPRYKHIDFTRDKDAWGRGKYMHSHVQALFEGFCEGAAWSAAQDCTGGQVVMNGPAGVLHSIKLLDEFREELETQYMPDVLSSWPWANLYSALNNLHIHFPTPPTQPSEGGGE